MEVDITKYAPIIADILLKLKVPKAEREDIAQECYVALLEKQKHLEHGIEVGDENNYAATICRTRVLDIRRKEPKIKSGDDEKKKVRVESMSDPRVFYKVMKIGDPRLDNNSVVTPDQLDSAILSLPFDEYRVVYELYVQGKTQEKVASELGISLRTVITRNQKGIEGLKKYFGVDS